MNFRSDQPDKPDRRDRLDEPAFVGHAQGETIWLAFKGEEWRTVRREKTPGTFSAFIPFLKDFY